ncbi:hypothetical protein [Azospirillum argentinense]|uniref:hypothetical protein n=1 Tax=Azospirillum argentinense TaxID=2970906 RepID=UPI0032E03179
MMATKIYATLVHGNVYWLGEKRFEAGKRVEVTADEREHLKTHAIDSVTINAGTTSARAEVRQKFEFETPEATAAEPAATVATPAAEKATAKAR